MARLTEGLERVLRAGSGAEPPYAVDNLSHVYRHLAKAESLRGNTEAARAAEERAAARLKGHWSAFVAGAKDPVPPVDLTLVDVAEDFRNYGEVARAGAWLDEVLPVAAKLADADPEFERAHLHLHRQYLEATLKRLEVPGPATMEERQRLVSGALEHIGRWQQAATAQPPELVEWTTRLKSALEGVP